MYSRLVREDGIVASHDVVKHTRDLACEVDLFWKEIKQQHRHEEFMKARNRG